MNFVDNGDLTDPRLNLALEEFLLRQPGIEEPLMLLYVNEPSVILGRNQNVFEEVDPRYTSKSELHLLRRLSGGGTVYHDLGNLNYSFITPGQADLHRFEHVTEPIIRVLRELGVGAEFRERSDIVVGGKKISGNAQYASKGRLLTHGTLLFDADLQALSKALRPDQRQIKSRAVQSVRSKVRNIRELLPTGWRMADFKQALLAGVFGTGNVPIWPLGSNDWDEVQHLAEERYMSWQWNIGRSPRFSLVKSAQLSGRTLEVRIEVEKGLIREIEGRGDFFDPQESFVINQILQGVRYDPDDLLAALSPLEGVLFGDRLSIASFVALLY